jgi:DNA mismatch repair protein MutL
MADIIKLLPDHIANQIAAGEVVQRPASVVKELMENAIDAGAKNIKLIIKNAGKTHIQIIDDGVGMSETDARLSFERHATSKIRITEDLFNILTMGFRGEALASIAAVAQVELRTKQHNQELGTQIIVEGSKIITQEPCQATAGTSITVKNLFYNIPARRNFLKADAVEMRHIIDEFQQIALAHPHVFFSLHHNSDKIYHLPTANLRQRIVGIFGPKSNQALIPIEEETDLIKIYGYIGKPEFAKKMRGEQFFFVNSRFIKSSYLHHALMLAFEDLLPAKMYPLYVVFFELDPAKIDINVHPTKQEIKFEDERLVYNYLRVTARHALAQNSITPSLDFEAEQSLGMHLNEDKHPKVESSENEEGIVFNSRLSNEIETKEFFSSKISGENSGKPSLGSVKWPNEKTGREESNLKNWEKLYEGLQSNSSGEEEEGEIQESFDSSISGLNTLGFSANSEEFVSKQLYQLHNTFIIRPLKSGFMLIDQNAAHQRILFEQFLNSFDQKEPLVQTLLFPQNINLSIRDSEMLLAILPELNAMGIDIREFGNNSFIIHGLPVEMTGMNEQKLIEDLLEQYLQGMGLKLDIRQNIAKSLAFQSAIKSGKSLSQPEMLSIADNLFACEYPFMAPNGKKTCVKIELAELLKRFE